MENSFLLEKLQGNFPAKIVEIPDAHHLLTILVDVEDITDVLRFLKLDNELQFIHLTDITAVHYPHLEKEFTVVYHIHSLIHNIRIRVKVFFYMVQTRKYQRRRLFGKGQIGWSARPMIFLV
jgi:NADH-quinone oxidoreductase subunit C